MASSNDSFYQGRVFVSVSNVRSAEDWVKVPKELEAGKPMLSRIGPSEPARHFRGCAGSVHKRNVIKITRMSETAGECITYRLVING